MIQGQLSTPDASRMSGGLVWNDLTVQGQVQSNHRNGKTTTTTTTTLLEPFSGVIANGELTAILGPSGSGKTTLVAALTHHIPKSLPRTGQVYKFQRIHQHHQQHQQNGISLSHIPPQQVAWVQQHDAFFSMLTVYETLLLAAFLELPHVSSKDRRGLVQTQLDALGLAHVAHQRVGDASSMGGGGGGGGGSGGGGGHSGAARLSGGERRRLSVALELLTDKALFVADEPTSGLDCAMSVKVIQLIKNLCVSRHIPGLCVVHQPSSVVWHTFDAVILMAAGGRVCYAGPRSHVLPYLHQLGYPCPPETNPAEFLIDLVTMDSEDPQKAANDKARIVALTRAFRKHQHEQRMYALTTEASAAATAATRTTEAVQTMPKQEQQQQRRSIHIPLLFIGIPRFAALLRRSFRQNIRNSFVNAFRLATCIVNGLLLVAIFPSVQGTQKGIYYASSMSDRLALLNFSAVILCNMAFLKASDLFAKEKPVVQREHVRQQYTTLEYVLAKALAELPLDATFSMVFCWILKRSSGLHIPFSKLALSMSVLTVSGAALGFVVGSILPAAVASTAGIPVLVVLMCVGIITPGSAGSGGGAEQQPPLIVALLRTISPFYHGIQALCIGEFEGLVFTPPPSFSSDNGDSWYSWWWQRIKSVPYHVSPLSMVQSGDQVLEALGLAVSTVHFHSVIQSLWKLCGACLGLSWMALWMQQQSQIMVHSVVNVEE